MEKERKQSILYGMGEELIICPICKGMKIIMKTNTNGEICYYGDRVTAIREPCPHCNGTGIIMKRR